MVNSKYISDIIDLLLDGDDEGFISRRQLAFISEEHIEYTGSGLFVRFAHSNEIRHYKIKKNELTLNGVKIQTTEYPIEADASLFFKNGLIDYLEIWCYLGTYPNQDLTRYTLIQSWENSSNKIITNEY